MSKKHLFLFAIVFYSCVCFSQSNQNTFWGGIGLKTSITKNFRFDFEQQVRLKNNLSEFKNYFSEAALNYQLKKFRFNGNYRYMIWQRAARHRLAGDVYLKLTPVKKKVNLIFRERIQEFTWVDDKSKKTDFRSLVLVEYMIKKAGKLFLGNEIFFRLNGINQIRNYRFSFGANWKLSDQINLMTYYNLQTSVNIDPATANHMFVLRLFYKISPFNKTKN